MSSTTDRLRLQGLIKPPAFLENNVHYEVLMGSMAYGVSTDSSDMDVYGFCVPPKHIIFPHLDGYIMGFGNPPQGFDQYQQHHIYDKDALGGKGRNYDISIYNIVKYFDLCMQNNPNMIDSLFVPSRCVLYTSAVGNMVREHRRMFLHKGCFHKFKGYAFSQKHKMLSQTRIGKRKEVVEQYGYDVKFAYHLVRLLSEVEQILTVGNLQLDEYSRREHMKAIRNGEVPLEDVINWFNDKEQQLEKLYHKSTLPYSPPVNKIKNLLLSCLEHIYGSLDNMVTNIDKYHQAIIDIKQIVGKL